MRRPLVLLALLALAACSPGPPPFDEEQAVERGRSIAQATFQALSLRLQQAMATAGPAHAVDLCSVAALPIADSLAAVHRASIKRTSDRLRAPHDAPDAHERERLDAMLDMLASGTRPADLPAQAFVLGDSIAFYQPILIASPLCLTCHGVPGQGLDSAAQTEIARRYPGDRATGYAVGDFRGLWSIRWPR